MKKIPELLLKSLCDVRGFDEKAFTDAHTHVPMTSVRLHPLKKSGAFAEDEKVPWCSEGRYLTERPKFTLDPLFHAGAYYVQEASSMFLDHLLKSFLGGKKGLRVLDLCAAPGGKSTLIASYLDKESLLVSNEVIRTRAPILEENMTKWGFMNTWVTSNDPRDFSKLTGYFDVIVVDAPCSGSGLFRKDEKAINEWSEANVNLCSQRQQRILADVWPALKENGILVYATCSYSPQEDEEILDWLATEFEVRTLETEVPERWGIVQTSSPQKGMKGYRFFPDKIKGEGFFIAVVQKAETEDAIKYPKYKALNDKIIQQKAGYLLENKDLIFLPNTNKLFSAILPCHEQDALLLQKALYLRKAGVELGEPSHKEWLPSHDVALSIDLAGNLNKIALNKEQALHFLKKEEIPLQVGEKGWYIVTYEGLGLGWVKCLGNRYNNYLPKNRRIRMAISDADWT